MKKNFLRLLFPVSAGSSGRIKYIRLIFFLFWFCFACYQGWGAVSITSATGGTNICNNKAVGGSAAGFTTLTPIVLTESANSDFSGGTSVVDVIVLTAPSGWQFNTTLPTFSYITGSNITSITGSITSSTLTINISVNSTTSADQLTITGLQVQATSASSSSGNIYASSVTGVAGISSGTSGTNFGSLSLLAPATPSVSISGSPSGSICPGTSVTFTPTATNGGAAPSYHWYLNGTSVALGNAYAYNSFSSGNTVYCTMTSSNACVTASTVMSNTVTMTVIAAPFAVTGTTIICPGMTSTLSNATPSGTWSSSNTSVATVSSGGVVSAIATGTAVISYIAGGCPAIATMYINAPPIVPVLTPTATAICNGGNVTIATSGTAASSTILSQNFNGSISPWTVDNTGSVGTLPGSEWKSCGDGYVNEQGSYHSPDNSTFVMSNSDTSGSSSFTSSKLTSPSFSLLGYSSATLTFQHSYDYWPSGDIDVKLEVSTNGGSSWSTIANYLGATIGAKTGFVTQTYSLNAYLGNSSVMIRYNYYCHWGYYWAIDNVLITGTPALVTPVWSPTTYLFSDAAFGTAYTGTASNTVYVHPTTITTPTVITYTATATQGGCTSASTSIVTINPSPGATTGNLNLCVGTTSTLSNSASGGTWVSSNPSVATVGSSSGVTTGVALGTALISYISGTSCAVVSVVTVNSSPGTISGSPHLCLGNTSTLSSATPGGTWVSSNSSIASIGSASGIVTASSLGTANITYSLGAGCTLSTQVTVHSLPSAITGSNVICAGQTTTLNDVTTGGSWGTGTPAIASVGSGSGIVTGVSGGVANITYTVTTTGCTAVMPVTVNPMGPITGNTNACLGYTSALANVATGGVWTSGNTSVATIDPATGVVSGLALGTSNITYSVSATGCVSYAMVTVNALPSDITGANVVCAGSSISLSDATTGGTWSSSSGAIATVGTSGSVIGIGAGNATITYTASTGCYKTMPVTVNPVPTALVGNGTVCAGLATALSSSPTTGTWSSSNTTYATVGPTGMVSGIAAGTVNISYTLPTTCFTIRTITVNPLPESITGPGNVCLGNTITLSDATSGGTWTSSNSSTASVTTGGAVTGNSASTAIITYTLPTSCIATYTITVNSLPANISGPSSACTAATIVLTDATDGGTWSSSNISLATVNSTGIVTGVSTGTVAITYTISTGCIKTTSINVNPSPAAITGNTSACVGFSSSLSDITPLGSWSSSNSSIASVGASTGALIGVAPGTAIITYSLATGCMDTALVTVYTVPAAITGNTFLCLGQSSALEDVSTGGSWSSGTPAIAGIGTGTGIVIGAGIGSAVITYTVLTGCFSTTLVTVNPLPSTITGSSTVCVGSTANYISSAGGTWSSSNTSVASIGGSSGIVTGQAAGTAYITYTLPTGCTATKLITVNPIPAVIVGPSNVCQGSFTTYTDATSGGTWSSSSSSAATIGPATGLVTGISGGTIIITYTLSTGCLAAMPVTVTALPSSITGPGTVCQGNAMLLNDATTGGSWISGSPSVATIGATTGLVNGITPGTSVMTYILPVGCVATTILTVNPLPAAIAGNTNLCLGVPTTLTDGTAGGIWTSNNPSIADIDAATGIVTGHILGTVGLTYTLSTSCIATVIGTVNVVPSIISGASGVCIGYTTALANVVGGGAWSSSNTSLATVGSSTGIVTGVSNGPVTITYTLPIGCFVTKSMMVNPLPQPITGTSVVCQGLSTVLADITTGGTWSSGNASIAAVLPSTGSVTGAAAGTTFISYTLSTGCFVTRAVTIYALPSSIGGSGNLCLGYNATLTTTTPGGSWISGNTAVATIDPVSGVASGLTLGTSIITYAIGSGCSVNKTVTVNPLPDAISGTLSTCPGVTVSLTNTTSGGSWSSGSTSIATVGSNTGIVSGLTAGTAMVSYTISTGCFSTAIFTVNAVPPITGNSSICIGAINPFTHSVSGGTWTSSNTAVANVGLTSGIVVGYTVNTAIISYRLPGGCIAVFPVSVNALPAAITGTGSVCPGFTTTLSSLTPGGSWSSANPSNATVGSGTGIVTGVVMGAAPSYVIITYAMPSGCSVSKVVTVNPQPAAITGTSSLCVGTSSTFTSAAPGGTWSSSNPSVASAGLISGLISGLTIGAAGITYTPSAGCVATAIVTVNGLPSPISGTTNLCSGTTSSLSDGTLGGIWSSTNTSVATISSTGTVSCITPGTSIISYTAGLGCASTATITVNIMPAPVTGIPSVCQGYTTALGSTPSGGSWTSSNTSVATVGAGSGLVSGAGSGTVVISYSFSGCSATRTVTVSAPPSVIAGTPNACVGLTSTLSDPALGGGTWSSSNASIASIGSATGVVTGNAAGTATITYTIGTGCNTVTVFSVNPVPSPITGILNACVGMTTTLADATPGGTWNGDNPYVATINSSGIVNGIFAGVTNITYALSTGCMATKMVTINPLPGITTGPGAICQGSSAPLYNGVAGGSWSSSNTTVATVGAATGDVLGVSGGSAIITYAVGAGCFTTTSITINSLPASISGASSVCQGLTTALNSTTPGGAWSSSLPAIADVNISGVVTGGATGSATITYTVGITGCSVTKDITVNPLAPITGNPNLCIGFTTSLSNANSGGTWQSGNTGIATVNSTSGLVSGVAAGTAQITYTLPTGCKAIAVVTVIAVTPVTGTANICAGSTTILSNASTGGTWSSTNTSVAPVDPLTGTVAANTAGTAIISYTFGTGCVATRVITVNPLAPITGTNTVCAGYNTTYNNIVPGGTWSSSDMGIATVGGTGIVHGEAAGTAAITYVLSTGCQAVKVVSVNPLAAISGPSIVCAGYSVTLTNSVTGGTWSSANNTVASANTYSGAVAGNTPGTAAIAYTLASGCATSKVITVNPLPTAISGTANTCLGTTATLTDTTAGGTWSGSGSAASVGSSSGVVTGTVVGAAVISYTLPTGCFITAPFIVNPLPAAISGSLQVCEGLTTVVFDADTGGTWSSANTSVASIDPVTGVVTGIMAGTSAISYTLLTGCVTSSILTVNGLPEAIGGTNNVCVGQSILLTDVSAGGTWSTATPSIATVGASTGIVYGISAGIANVTYTLPTGCRRLIPITVNPLPSPVSGTSNVCSGLSTTFTATPSGGSWSSSNTSVAVIDGDAGTVNGLISGMANITYTLSTGCIAVKPITVNPLPAPISVSGSGNLCVGSALPLTNTTPAGTWNSGSTANATVSSSGMVTGVSAGMVSISYVLPTGCYTSSVITVNPLPGAITGPLVVCENASIILGNDVAGGSWSSSNPGKAIVDPVTGIVTGISTGTATITYTLATGCLKTITVTVNHSPATIAGAPQVCVGYSTLLTDASPGGAWSITGPAGIAAISASGNVNGVAAGNVVVSYTLTTGCAATTVFTVNPLPPATVIPANICNGASATLTNTVAGGTWSSSNISVATIGIYSGIVAGTASGTSIITYTLPTGCSTISIINISPLPLPISGPDHICTGDNSLLTNGTPGGLWNSSSPATISISSVTGSISAINTGTATIAYTLSTGCSILKTITVNPLPSPLSGNMNACIGVSSAFGSTTPGGTWSSGNPAVVTIGSASGVATGISLGTANIIYTLSTGCSRSLTATVNPVPAPVSGSFMVCQGMYNNLIDISTGGIWSSDASAIADVNALTGLVTGLLPGTATIHYSFTTGCSVSAVVTVNPWQPILGSHNSCVGDTLHLSDPVSGGSWASTAPGVAAISSSGALSCFTPGITVISYTLGSGCIATHSVTVQPSPIAFFVTGGGTFCIGNPGVPVGLNSSAAGFEYKLYNGPSLISSLLGTGSGLDFGLQSAGGTYNIIATNPITGCSYPMTSSAVVSPVAYGPAAVSITSSSGDTVCDGYTTLFTAVPYLGGSSPSYTWLVNGSSAGTGPDLSYIPDDGDIITCRLLSNASCATPDTASASQTVTVIPNVMPVLNISVLPGNIVCQSTPVTFTSAATHGGTYPQYRWMKNGIFADTGSGYSYTPLDGDIIKCILTSNERCTIVDTALSNSITMSVAPYVVPTVTVSATPGFQVPAGQTVTFTAAVSNGGPAPAYQWRINSTPVSGATTASFTAANLMDKDTVACDVLSSGVCSGIPATGYGIITILSDALVPNTGIDAAIRLNPNPNTGTFSISGSLGTAAVDEVTVRITGLLGQEVYNNKVKTAHGTVNVSVTLNEEVSNGIYLLTLQYGEERKIFHLVVRK